MDKLVYKYRRALELTQRVEIDIMIDTIKKFNGIKEGYRKFILTAKTYTKSSLLKVYTALEKLQAASVMDMDNLRNELKG